MEKQKGKFLRVVCSKCGNGQIIFGKACLDIKCARCSKLLVKTGGGKVIVRSIVRKVLIC